MCSISMLDSTLNLRTPSCRPWRDLSAEQTISTPPFELEKIYASEWRQLSNFTTQYLDLARNSYQRFHFRSEFEPGKERKSIIFFCHQGFEPLTTLMRSGAQTTKPMVSYEENKFSTIYTPSERLTWCVVDRFCTVWYRLTSRLLVALVCCTTRY